MDGRRRRGMTDGERMLRLLEGREGEIEKNEEEWTGEGDRRWVDRRK